MNKKVNCGTEDDFENPNKENEGPVDPNIITYNGQSRVPLKDITERIYPKKRKTQRSQ